MKLIMAAVALFSACAAFAQPVPTVGENGRFAIVEGKGRDTDGVWVLDSQTGQVMFCFIVPSTVTGPSPYWSVPVCSEASSIPMWE